MAKLYVGNLSYDVSDQGLQDVFAGKGFQVASARVILDMGTGRSRGFGFVELGNEEAARAITELHGAVLDGRALQVNEAKPQAPRGDNGGGDRGAKRSPRY